MSSELGYAFALPGIFFEVFMMITKVILSPLTEDDREQFILDNQWAFKYGAMLEFGKRDDTVGSADEIISRKTIEDSIDAVNAETYRIVFEGRTVGGVVLVIDSKTNHNGLDLFFIDPKEHGKGLGYEAWKAVEERYPETVEWETITPYYEKRNIHFYVNKCGFKITEFYNKFNPDPNMPTEDCDDSGPAEMFRFIKTMK